MAIKASILVATIVLAMGGVAVAQECGPGQDPTPPLCGKVYCGTFGDTCGVEVACGGCTAAGDVCILDANLCCTPGQLAYQGFCCNPTVTCASLGQTCGNMDQGFASCGFQVCGPPSTVTCGTQICGTKPDGCGGEIVCGPACCVPATSCGAFKCGVISDGCGGTLTCGPACPTVPAAPHHILAVILVLLAVAGGWRLKQRSS
jgi:hypothetical protein